MHNVPPTTEMKMTDWITRTTINAAIAFTVAVTVDHFWPDETVSISFFIGYSLMAQLDQAWRRP